MLDGGLRPRETRWLPSCRTFKVPACDILENMPWEREDRIRVLEQRKAMSLLNVHYPLNSDEGRAGLESRPLEVRNSVSLLLICCVTMGKLLHLSEVQFPHL